MGPGFRSGAALGGLYAELVRVNVVPEGAQRFQETLLPFATVPGPSGGKFF